MKVSASMKDSAIAFFFTVIIRLNALMKIITSAQTMQKIRTPF